MVRRIIVVAVSWLVVSLAAFKNPVFMVFGWPATGLLLLWAFLGNSADLRTAMPHHEPLVLARRTLLLLRALAVALAACAVVGTVTSVLPSMAYRSGNAMLYRFALSIVIAPLFWMIVFAMAVRAVRRPSPRRLASAAIAMLIAWPLLLGIRAAREPWLDLQHHVLVIAPNVLQAYAAAAVVASGLAIALGFLTARLTSGPVVVTPPRATLRPAHSA